MIEATHTEGLSPEEIKKIKWRMYRVRYKTRNPEKIKAQKKAAAQRAAEKIAAYQKAYRVRRKKELSAQRGAHYRANKDRIYEGQKRSIAKNREKVLAYYRSYNKNPEYLAKRRQARKDNPPTREELEKHNKRSRAAYRADPKKSQKRVLAYRKKRKAVDHAYKILQNLRSRIRNVIRGHAKSAATMLLIGCSKDELMAHLERQFKPGMTWENYGFKGWHVDHRRPCAAHRMEDPEEQRRCFHFSNLQPLWWIDNIRKKDKIIDEIAA